MSFDPFERVPLGSVEVTRLGFGGAEIGGLYQPIGDGEAVGLVDRAWDLGIRYFDTAPLYGYGNSERRIGRALRRRNRSDFALSSKVGRLLYPADGIPTGADIDRQEFEGTEDFFYPEGPPVRVVFDYSYDAVMRSVESSLARLGLERIDILYIHDPDDHWAAAIGGAYPALHQLRSEGVVGAIGAGMNQAEMLARFAREGDFDCFMLAGRYTLLDQAALPELLPLCLDRGIAIVVAGVMNSGILANPHPGARFDYLPAAPQWIDRAQRLQVVCTRHGVPLRAAAVQFPLAHPAVTCLVTGVRRVSHLDEYPSLLQHPIPDDLWVELRAEGLLPPEAPVPPGGKA
jgi:D-threo-aldose 1-dehydrogenase